MRAKQKQNPQHCFFVLNFPENRKTQDAYKFSEVSLNF